MNLLHETTKDIRIYFQMVFNTLEDSRSYGRRMRYLVEDINLNVFKVLSVATPQFPPWTDLVELDLRFKAEIRIFFFNTSKYQGSSAIYTDSSKSKNGVALQE